MTWRDLKARYTTSTRSVAANRALRAEVPGAADLLAAADKLHVALLGPAARDLPAADRRAYQAAADGLRAVLDGLADRVLARHGIVPGPQTTTPGTRPGEGRSSAKGPSRVGLNPRPEGRAADGRGAGPPAASIHAGLPATAAVSTARPAPSSGSPLPVGDPARGRDWTPPAAVVARMGRESDKALAADCRVAERTVRAARERLGIDAYAPPAAAFDGAALRAARGRERLSGAALAERAGIAGGKAYVSQLEAGLRTPTAATVGKLAAVLGPAAGWAAPTEDR